MSRRRVLVAGGGVAAVEALLGLRELAPRAVDLTLLAPGRSLVLAPETVLEATVGSPAARYDLAGIAQDLGATFVNDALDAVEAGERLVLTGGGRTLEYDALLLALGALPGHTLPGALRFAGPRDVAALRAELDVLSATPRPSIVLTATGGVGWTLPLYDLACLIAVRYTADGIDHELAVVTAEAQPLGLFGRPASRAVAGQLAALGVTTYPGAIAERAGEGRLWMATGESLPADLVVALPEPVGPSIPGLPLDDRGFVPVDPFGRVSGVEAVWAAGDVTSRPLKQGGLAVQQADAAATSIAAWAGAGVEPQPYEPVLRGMLLTGMAPRYLRRPAASTVPGTSSGQPQWSLDAKIAGGRLARYLDVHPDLRIDRPMPARS